MHISDEFGAPKQVLGTTGWQEKCIFQLFPYTIHQGKIAHPYQFPSPNAGAGHQFLNGWIRFPSSIYDERGGKNIQKRRTEQFWRQWVHPWWLLVHAQVACL